MRNNRNLIYGILIGIIIGCLIGYFVGRRKTPSKISPTQTISENGTPIPETTPEGCPICPCKSWSIKNLPAPEWRDDLDKKADLKTDYHGHLSVRWKPVEGTRYYIVYYEDKNGKQLKTKNSGGESFLVQEIPLPEGVSEDIVYISVAAANAKRDPGARSKKLKVLARAPVNTVAPMIKDIKVEE